MFARTLRRGLTAAALLSTLAACGRVQSCRGGAAADAGVDAGPKGPPAWSVVQAGIGEDGVWSDGALTKAFAMTVAPLPGVDVPPADDSVPSCRGDMLRQMEARVDKLPPAQRDAIKKTLAEDAPSQPVQNAIAMADPGAAPYRESVTRANAWVARFLGRPEVDLRVESIGSLPSASGRGTVYADAYPICPRSPSANIERRADYRLAGPNEDTRTCACRVRLTRAGRDLPSSHRLFEVLVHELTHCHQFRHQDRGFGSAWVAEGHAMWVQSRAFAESGARDTDSLIPLAGWGAYAVGDTPNASTGRLTMARTLHPGAFALMQALSNEGYDAKLGPFALASTPDGAAFDRLATAKPAAFAAWASQSIVEEPLGPPWVPSGPGLYLGHHRAAQVLPRVSRGQSRTVTAGALGQQVSYVPIGTGDVVEISTGGFGRAIFGGLGPGDRIGHEGNLGVGAEVGWQRPESFLYCLKPEGCDVGFPIPLARSGYGVLVAVTGRGAGGASVSVTPYSMEEIRTRVNCIYGRWKYDDHAAFAAIGARLAGSARLVSVAVDDVLDIRRDGTFREEVRSAAVELVAGGIPVRSTASGARAGRIEVRGNRLVTRGVSDDLQVRPFVKLGDQWTPAPMDRAQAVAIGSALAGQPQPDGTSGSVPYQCAGSQLTLDAPEGRQVYTRLP